MALGANGNKPESCVCERERAARLNLHALHQDRQGAYVEPIVEQSGYRFTVKVGKPKLAEVALNGTKLGRGANFQCVVYGMPIGADYIRAEAKAGRMGARLMATVAEGDRGRIYLPPTELMGSVAQSATPEWKPEVEFFQQALGFRIGNYGMTKWSDLFTLRQTVALTTFSDLVVEARAQVLSHAESSGTLAADPRSLDQGGAGPTAYADAVSVYLGFGVDREFRPLVQSVHLG